MADPGKRKAHRDADGGAAKKKKKGNNGKWRAPKSEGSERPKANTIEPGDVGIWVTCPLHMKGKAAREMELLFDHYAEKIYGIKTEAPLDGGDDDDDQEGDIEAAIQKEVGDLQNKNRSSKTKSSSATSSNSPFTEVRITQECLLFMQCRPPVEPVDFSRRICLDAARVGHGGAQARYLNRLTPLSVIVRASENGLEEGARRVLAGHFKLKPKEGQEVVVDDNGNGSVEKEEQGPPATFAIRPSIRNHNTLKRDDVIKRIANMVDPQHKVNLDAPDKVILIDIYQSVCGLSVVPGDWDSLKRYNLTELYKQKPTDHRREEEKEGAGGETVAGAVKDAPEIVAAGTA